MRVKAITTFMTVRGEILAGSILNIPDSLLAKLSGKVLPICQAVKVGGRICGATL